MQDPSVPKFRFSLLVAPLLRDRRRQEASALRLALAAAERRDAGVRAQRTFRWFVPAALFVCRFEAPEDVLYFTKRSVKSG